MIGPGGNAGGLRIDPMVHIGNLIKARFERMPRSYTVARFARQLHCRRGNIYDIFKRETIDTELLKRISKALNHDFFRDLSADLSAGERSDALPEESRPEDGSNVR